MTILIRLCSYFWIAILAQRVIYFTAVAAGRSSNQSETDSRNAPAALVEKAIYPDYDQKFEFLIEILTLAV